MNPVEKLGKLLTRTFEKGAWYGPSVMEVLSTLDASAAKKRLPGTHSIGELVAHMVAWRTYVVKRLQGDTRFTVDEENNFPKNIPLPDAIRQLKENQDALMAALKTLPPEKLDELVPAASHRYTFYTMLHGIVNHDIYHIGQIVLINKAVK